MSVTECATALLPGQVAEMMAEYGRSAGAAVSRYLPNGRRAPFLDDLVADYPSRGGKMMRASICLANAAAFGSRADEALPFAAAIEILHNGLLVHDDIQDESDLRRGRPTLHRLHGVPLAINAGDALMLLALEPLFDSLRHLGPRVADQVIAVTKSMARETAEGQALELGWRDGRVTTLTESDYLNLVLKKTAWLATIWPAQIGLMIGSRGHCDPASVVRFGFFLGAAFQIEDDLRNLGAGDAYGKEADGDLFEAKRTLMLIHAHGACGVKDRRRLDEFLALRRADRTGEMVAWLTDLLVQQGSIDHARTVAGAFAGAALHEFELAYGALPASRHKAFIGGLPTWVLARP